MTVNPILAGLFGNPHGFRTRWENFKIGKQVEDIWYRDCGRGTILSKGKRKMIINFPGTWGDVTYDRPHATRFLEIVSDIR